MKAANEVNDYFADIVSKDKDELLESIGEID